MRRTLFMLVALLILSVSYSVYADDEAWEIVERCFGDATEPPADWTFDGTLLMTSPGRLHAYRQEWDTPRILGFYEQSIPNSGVLSPDGHWYAVIEGDAYYGQVSNLWETRAIHVYGTSGNEKYTVPWETSFSFLHRFRGHQLYWLNNQQIVYSQGQIEHWFSINPFTQEIEALELNFDPKGEDYYPAPDYEKAILYQWTSASPWMLDTGENTFELPLLWGSGSWRPDSQAFAAYTLSPQGQQVERFALFDLNGHITAELSDAPDQMRFARLLTSWSPQADYLLFAAEHLYIADMKNQQIIDTCVPAERLRSVVWSPNENQFALLTAVRDAGIQIFDLNTWERYVVGYHAGDIIGWRADDGLEG